MINTRMKEYKYYLPAELDEYGQQSYQASKPMFINMSVSLLNQSSRDNVLYNEANYVGLTHDDIKDGAIVEYGTSKLKVVYVNSETRYTQVYMREI